MDIDILLEEIEQILGEIQVRTDFKFEEIKLDYKEKELYTRVLVDNIAPYYFAVIRESKYDKGLDNLNDSYRASIEYQSFAYKNSDYSTKKADVLTGLVRNFVDLKSATRWLRDKVKENFVFTLKEERDV